MTESRQFSPRIESLPAAQRELWPELRALRNFGFVLHGGTAIALRLGHRISVDFDFFADTPLDADRILTKIPRLTDATTIQSEPNSYGMLVEMPSGPVKLSLFGGITFGRVGVPQETSDGVAVVAAPKDLLAQKLKVVMQRVESKDYRDIAAILRAGLDLGSGLADAVALFGGRFSPAECTRALVYFKEGDLETLPAEDRRTLLDAVRDLDFDIAPSKRISDSIGP